MRIRVLDALRGIAALSVVFFHYTFKYNQIYGHTAKPKWSFYYGQYGVELFFVISGFVIFMTVENVITAKDFLTKRCIRLYPTYWACLIITFTCVRLFGLPGLETSVKDFVLGLTMVPVLFNAKLVDGAYWSLVPELCFYICMALIMISGSLKKIYIILIAWLFIIIINHFYHLPVVSFLLNVKYGIYFIAGIVFYKLKHGNKNLINHIVIIGCLISSYLVYTHEMFYITILIVLVFYLFTYNKLNVLEKDVFIFFGKISYPLYLIHQYSGYITIRYLYSIHFHNYLFIILIPLFICIIAAWVITEYVEKPLITFLRKKLHTGYHP